MTQISKKISAKEIELATRQTPWGSVYITAVLLTFVGIQNGVYFTSTWQYLEESDSTVKVDFLGFVIGAHFLASALANPILGYWNQISGTTKKPVVFAFLTSAIGNVLYGTAYLYTPYVKYVFVVSRFLTGMSPGSLSVLRSFVGTATTKEDRMKAVSLTNAGFAGGFFLGPAIQIVFFPLGKEGFWVGLLHFNMYTSCAFFIGLLSVLSALLAHCCIDEDYVGIISSADKKEDPFFVLPTFDRVPVALLFYMWWLMCGVVCIESMAAALTIAVYNWSPEDAVLYNGIIQALSCIVSTLSNVLIAKTRLQYVDQRKLLLFGLANFLIFFVLHSPLPVYPAPLDRPLNETMLEMIGSSNSTLEELGLVDGRCIWDWCDYTPRIPLWTFVLLYSAAIGFGFPFVSCSTFTLLTQIIGPRKQGTIQGLFAFTGSFAQFVVSLFSTALFNGSGYKWIMVYHASVTVVAILSVVVFWQRLIALSMLPDQGKATRYKHGTFYRM